MGKLSSKVAHISYQNVTNGTTAVLDSHDHRGTLIFDGPGMGIDQPSAAAMTRHASSSPVPR